MTVASIVCVDGELDVHDTASAAITAAIERRRELATARIGLAVGDLELGDPLGLATRLSGLAPAGAILVSDQLRRVAERDGHRFVDLGAVSTAGYLDRVHVFELDGATSRERTVLASELQLHGRVVLVGEDTEEDARHDARITAFDRTVWRVAGAHRGLIASSRALDHAIAFADPIDAFRAALALDTAVTANHDALGTLRCGLDRGTTTYVAGHWGGTVWRTAERIRSSRFRHVGASMSLVAAVGPPALRELGLVIEVVEEVVQKGVRDPVSVAHLRIA